MLTGLMSTMSTRLKVRGKLSYFLILTEALIADIEVPQIDAEVVTGDVCFTIRVDGNRINVIRMRILVDFPGYCSNNAILYLHSRKTKCRRLNGRWTGLLPLVMMIIRRHNLDAFVKHFPQLDGFIFVGD